MGPKPRSAVEALEGRRLFCLDHVAGEFVQPVELRQDLVAETFAEINAPRLNAAPEATEASDADIVWVNRGSATNDVDRFNSTFGADADAARAVVDAVIGHFERMIGSFAYPDGSKNFDLTVQMHATGGGNGASASLMSTLAGKPKTGRITLGRGPGWFLDPTPNEHSEFQGSIVNAFTGDATPDSPAYNKSDLYTVVAAELTHSLGLFGGTGMVPLWDNRISYTGITDTAEGGGVGEFFVFRGPSIQHLMSGNNGGPGGMAFNGAVHTAGPTPGGVWFEGQQYFGGHDIGNAVYEWGRRYTPDAIFSLMFRDAYGYATVNPAKFGTFYASYDQTTRQLLVRGGTNGSDDRFDLSTRNGKLVVSVDVGNDTPGSGSLPGPGNLPAFVSEFDLGSVRSIVLQAGDGNDVIDVGSLDASVASLSLAGGEGSDSFSVTPSAQTRISIDAGAAADDLSLRLDGATQPYAVGTTGGSGRLVFANRNAIAFSGVETLPAGMSAPRVGDLNGDSAINNQDIAPFTLALTDPTAYLAQFSPLPVTYLGDLNDDGVLNNQDIAPFVALLTGATTTTTTTFEARPAAEPTPATPGSGRIVRSVFSDARDDDLVPA